MKTTVRMFVLLLLGLVALSGCSAIRSMLHEGSDSADAASADMQEETSGEEAADTAVADASFKFYESSASW